MLFGQIDRQCEGEIDDLSCNLLPSLMNDRGKDMAVEAVVDKWSGLFDLQYLELPQS